MIASDKTAHALKEVAGSPKSYAVFSGKKRCGGFHPDYAVVWSESDNTYSILFCYGCAEALIVNRKATYRYNFIRITDIQKLLEPLNLK